MLQVKGGNLSGQVDVLIGKSALGWVDQINHADFHTQVINCSEEGKRGRLGSNGGGGEKKWNQKAEGENALTWKSDLMSGSPLTRRPSCMAVKRVAICHDYKGLLCSGVEEASLELSSCGQPRPVDGKTKTGPLNTWCHIHMHELRTGDSCRLGQILCTSVTERLLKSGCEKLRRFTIYHLASLN